MSGLRDSKAQELKTSRDNDEAERFINNKIPDIIPALDISRTVRSTNPELMAQFNTIRSESQASEPIM